MFSTTAGDLSIEPVTDILEQGSGIIGSRVKSNLLFEIETRPMFSLSLLDLHVGAGSTLSLRRKDQLMMPKIAMWTYGRSASRDIMHFSTNGAAFEIATRQSVNALDHPKVILAKSEDAASPSVRSEINDS